MQSRGQLVVSVAIGAAFLAYQFLVHKITITGQLTPTTAALILVPFIAAAGWAIALELGLRPALLIIAALTLPCLAAAIIFGLPQPAIIFGLPHLVSNVFLLWFFGRTLKNGQEPLITSIARHVSGPLALELEIYTRRITVLWSLFFALQVVFSIGLYAFASLETWSIFINILNAPLIVLMFVCEYTYRVLRYRDHRSSILSGLQFFSRGTPTTKPPKVR